MDRPGLSFGEGAGCAHAMSSVINSNLAALTASRNLDHTQDGLRTSLTMRSQGAGVIDNRYIQCSSGCPAVVGNAVTIENNRIGGSFYMDASVSYRMDVSGVQVEPFLTVRNLLNADPTIVPQGPTDFTYTSSLSKGSSGFDILGRVFRAGLRFKM